MTVIFWVSLLIIAYTYIGYPVLVYLLSLVFRRRVKKSDIYPKVSILISAYNEEKFIEAKIKSILELDYPQDKIEVLIGSDGSNDKTDSIVMKYITSHQVTESPSHQKSSENIKLFRLQLREGKPSVLNSLAEQVKNEILVFTDARQRLEKSSLKELVANFSDDKVGSVSAELIFSDADKNNAQGISLYWQYEKFIRLSESKLGSMLGATGAMYAIRKELFPALPKDLILDDVYIPLKSVEKGFRAIFEPKAIIFDSVSCDAEEEFQRKARTLTGNFQIFTLLKKLFNPFVSPIAIQLFSHKFLRLTMPFFLICLFVSNVFILDEGIPRAIFITQVIFYILAIMGLFTNTLKKVTNVPKMFLVMNTAAVVGLYRFLFNKQSVAWKKTN